MAVVADAFVATQSRTVFTKPPDVVRWSTAIPRAIVNFTVVDGNIAAKPLNDTQRLNIAIPLDPTFAYRWLDLSVDLQQDVANDWQTRPFIQIVNGLRNLPLGATLRYPLVLENSFDAVIPSEVWMIPRLSRPPSIIIQARAAPIDITFINFFATNQNAAAGGVGVLNALFTFLEYEIEQAESVAMHYAGLTYDRGG